MFRIIVLITMAVSMGSVAAPQGSQVQRVEPVAQSAPLFQYDERGSFPECEAGHTSPACDIDDSGLVVVVE